MTEERIFEKREKTKFESEKKEMERRWVEQKIENWKLTINKQAILEWLVISN